MDFRYMTDHELLRYARGKLGGKWEQEEFVALAKELVTRTAKLREALDSADDGECTCIKCQPDLWS